MLGENGTRTHVFKRGNVGNLGGASITFKMKDDHDGRRVEIESGSDHLYRSIPGLHFDLLTRNVPFRPESGTLYLLMNLKPHTTMHLRVVDLHPRQTTGLPPQPTKELLMTLQSLCL
jgi:hypothetical protein